MQRPAGSIRSIPSLKAVVEATQTGSLEGLGSDTGRKLTASGIPSRLQSREGWRGDAQLHEEAISARQIDKNELRVRLERQPRRLATVGKERAVTSGVCGGGIYIERRERRAVAPYAPEPWRRCWFPEPIGIHPKERWKMHLRRGRRIYFRCRCAGRGAKWPTRHEAADHPTLVLSLRVGGHAAAADPVEIDKLLGVR